MSQRRNSHQPLRRRFSVASVPPLALCVAAILIGWPQNLSAQNNPSHRDDDEPAQREASDVDRAPSRAPVRIDLAMQQMAEQVRLEDAPLEQALTAWSQATDVPLLIDWDKLEVAGVSRDTPISLRLEAVPADHLLNLMLRQASTDLATLMYEITPYFLRITTQEQLNRETVVRIYDVQDLLIRPRDFGSLESRVAGAGGGAESGGSSLFDDGDTGELGSRRERAETLVALIRELIEPRIWSAHGGQHASIRHFRGRLIVRAPLYVHAQIGTPIQRRSVPSPRAARQAASRPTLRGPTRRSSEGVSGISQATGRISGVRSPGQPMAGVREE